jgi:hypothetical protein
VKKNINKRNGFVIEKKLQKTENDSRSVGSEGEVTSLDFIGNKFHTYKIHHSTNRTDQKRSRIRSKFKELSSKHIIFRHIFRSI